MVSKLGSGLSSLGSRSEQGHCVVFPGGGGGYSLIWAIYTVGMCGPKGYGFSAVLVIDRVWILANFGHFGRKWGMVFAL